MRCYTSNMSKLPKTTTDDLAHMIAKGFEAVDRRFEAVDRRFDEMATKAELAEVKHKLEKVDYRVDQIYDIVSDQDSDIINLQKKVKTLETTVKILAK